MGYLGSVIVPIIRKHLKDVYIVGYDSGFFAHCLTGAPLLPEVHVDCQYFGDIRNINDFVLENIDGIIHLAALSNDPLGNKFQEVTSNINFEASVDLVRRATKKNIKRFVFASSCSMYGFNEGEPRKETDTLNPLTAYAKSKVEFEHALASMDHNETVITALRFSTACGMSHRLRLDLVLNDFVACAVASNEITILSDGSPWRPLIDVKDMALAMVWALTRDPKDSSNNLAVNVGSNKSNYQVSELAHSVKNAVPGTTVSINKDALPDNRSYRVDFSLYEKLAPNHQPKVTLIQSISELITGIKAMNFKDKNFRTSQFMRLKVLDKHLTEKRLNAQLFWS